MSLVRVNILLPYGYVNDFFTKWAVQSGDHVERR